MRYTRIIQIESLEDLKSYRDWKPLYTDEKNGRLIPNSKITIDDKTLLEINSLGCKGPELEENTPVIGVVGDSVTFGISMDTVSWVDSIHIPGYQTLNMGVEGYNIDWLIDRFQEVSEEVRFDAVLVYAGWHNIVYGETGAEYWEKSLSKFSGEYPLAFFTLACPLIEECLERGITPLLCSDQKREDYANYFEYNVGSLEKDYFNFWANQEPTLENIKQIYAAVHHYNDWLRGFCDRYGYAIFDIQKFLEPKSYDEVPKDFFDILHFRPSAYKRIGEWVTGEIHSKLRLPPRENSSEKRSIFKRLFSQSDEKSGEDVRKNMYTLW